MPWCYGRRVILRRRPSSTSRRQFNPKTLWWHRELLFALRLTAILCACLGFALMALRLGWKSFVATGLVLLIPHVPPDLTRAWAEGPLILGAGLCVLTFGTRWFGAACGLAATVKLTALGLWPLLLLRRANGGGRWARTLGVGSAALTWTLLTPQSWFEGGPLYILIMLTVRKGYYQLQTQLVGRPGFEGVAGIFLPTRYLIPFEFDGRIRARLRRPMARTPAGAVPSSSSDPARHAPVERTQPYKR